MADMICHKVYELLMSILNIYIYIYISSLESYMSRVLNTVVELIRLEDKLELLHMNFISLQICEFRMTRRVLPHSSGEFK